MERDEVRKAIARDLRGTPSRNPDSLIPAVAKQLDVPVETINTQLHHMKDLNHVVPVATASIRLSEEGERFYFATSEERFAGFLTRNWPHVTSNVIALLALVVAICALFFVPAADAHATEGTCSWHGGINCGAGADADGSAICNDGWKLSSELYFSALECSSIKHSCTKNEWEDFDREYKISEMRAKVDMLGKAQDRAFEDKYNTSLSSEKRQAASDDFYEISNEMRTLQSTVALNLEIAGRQCDALGEKNYRAFQIEQWKQRQAAANTPVACPANAYAVASDCYCNKGFVVQSNVCVVAAAQSATSAFTANPSTAVTPAALPVPQALRANDRIDVPVDPLPLTADVVQAPLETAVQPVSPVARFFKWFGGLFSWLGL